MLVYFTLISCDLSGLREKDGNSDNKTLTIYYIRMSFYIASQLQLFFLSEDENSIYNHNKQYIVHFMIIH